jgi:hypothetical protein
VKQGLILEQDAEESFYLNELDVRKPLVVSISQRSEELRFYNLVRNLTISNPGLKAVRSKLQMHLLAERFVFLRVMISVFWKRELRPI